MTVCMATGDIGRRFKIARESHEYRFNQSEIAEKLGISQARLSNWELGRHDPPTEAIHAAAKLFSRPIGWFYGSDTKEPPTSGPLAAPYADGQSHPKTGRCLFPILGVVGAAEFPIDPGDPEDFIEFSDDLYSNVADRFAVIVKGRSMRHLREGDFVLVHPNEAFRQTGHYVIARSPDSGFVVKILRKKDGIFYLEPESDGYDCIEMDGEEWRIVGPVIGHRREFYTIGKGGARNVRSYMEIGDNDGLTPEHYA